MNNPNQVDENLLKQVDDRLEHSKLSDHAIVNTVADALSQANSLPQADDSFRDDLEERLIARLQRQHQEKEEVAMFTLTTQASQRTTTYSYLTWAAALVVIVLMGGYLLTKTQSPRPTLPQSAVQVPTAMPMVTIVIATQNIKAGTTITADMVGVINLSIVDYDKLVNNGANHQFFSDIKQVVGQKNDRPLSWFEPIEPMLIGERVGCNRDTLQCVATPKGLYTISLPLPIIDLDTLGLAAGDHVDVLASENNQLVKVVEDVLLTEVRPDKITFAASSWKLGVLIWLWRSEQGYSLSRHQGEAAPRDETLINYTFTAPETLPDNYKFDLIVGLPDSKGYQLVGAPYALDSIQYTQREKQMQFWFTKLDVISITDGTTVVIHLPASDAALLDFLLKKGATLEFVPQ